MHEISTLESPHDSGFAAAAMRDAACHAKPDRRQTAAAFDLGPLREVDLDYEANDRILWCYMRPAKALCFTPGMMRELNGVHEAIRDNGRSNPLSCPRYCVVGSRLPGVFNLGGDLAYLVACIKARDKAALTLYAYGCIDAIHACSTGFDSPVISIGLVQGTALGGGFESAICFNVLIAERSVKMGFPEVLFGLFPGMGAYSFLSRKIGAIAAHKMIADGRMYGAGDLFDMGLIDILCADGEGEAAVRAYVARTGRRHGQVLAMNRVRNRVNPVPYSELKDVTDIWVDTAMALDASDLRRMQRLVSAQDRHGARAA